MRPKVLIITNEGSNQEHLVYFFGLSNEDHEGDEVEFDLKEVKNI